MLKAFIPVESTFYSFHGPSWYLSALVVFYVLAWFIVPRLVGNGEQERQEKNQTIIAVIYICVCAYVMQAALCFIVDWKCSGGGYQAVAYVCKSVFSNIRGMLFRHDSCPLCG